MSKQQLIENIRRHNPSARIEFLSSFDDQDLYKYLRRLRYMNRPRDVTSLWIRSESVPGASPWRGTSD